MPGIMRVCLICRLRMFPWEHLRNCPSLSGALAFCYPASRVKQAPPESLKPATVTDKQPRCIILVLLWCIYRFLSQASIFVWSQECVQNLFSQTFSFLSLQMYIIHMIQNNTATVWIPVGLRAFCLDFVCGFSTLVIHCPPIAQKLAEHSGWLKTLNGT